MKIEIPADFKEEVLLASLEECLTDVTKTLSDLKEKGKKGKLTKIEKEDVKYFTDLFKALLVVLSYYLPIDDASKLVKECGKIAGVAQR
jgi:hypothetical protein